jgi:glutathione S-transferase
MLTFHHLGKSQSERIVWLCEELAVPYELKRYTRDPVTILAPPDYKALHAIGAAPVITDGDLVLAESGAVVDYIMAKFGEGRLTLNSSHRDFAQYLYWFHFANGTLQANMGRNMILNRLKLADDNPILLATKTRVDRAFDLVEARAREAGVSGRQRLQRGGHHDGLFAHHHALFPALRSRARPQYRELSRADRQPPGVSPGDGEG